MNRPDDIPPEVWKTAEDAFDLMLCNCIEASGTTEQLRIDSITPLARAILAERERIALHLAGLGEGERALQYAARRGDDKRDALVHMYAAQTLETAVAAIRTVSRRE